jgi:hypothetical protein
MLTLFSRISSDWMEAYTLSVKFLSSSMRNGSLRDIVEAVVVLEEEEEEEEEKSRRKKSIYPLRSVWLTGTERLGVSVKA